MLLAVARCPARDNIHLKLVALCAGMINLGCCTMQITMTLDQWVRLMQPFTAVAQAVGTAVTLVSCQAQAAISGGERYGRALTAIIAHRMPVRCLVLRGHSSALLA